jgi:hypothetical protein
MQAQNALRLMTALIVKGASCQNTGTAMVKKAMAAKDDLLVGALVLKVKSSVLDTLDLDYRRLCAADLPHAAAQFLRRTMPDPGTAMGAALECGTVVVESRASCLAVAGQPIAACTGIAIDSVGNTHLHVCAAEAKGHALCLELLKIGISSEGQNAQGSTPLHMAAKAGNMEAAKALCMHGANLMARNKNNRTAKMLVSVPPPPQASALPALMFVCCCCQTHSCLNFSCVAIDSCCH